MHAVVVGAGPNGLTAALRFARAGWGVTVLERSDQVGGAAVTLGSKKLDLGAACHPFGAVSPAFRGLGVEWLRAPFEMAHPLEHGTGLLSAFQETTAALGPDARVWERLHAPVVEHIGEHLENVLAPMTRWPAHPLRLAQFGARGLWPATAVPLRTDVGRALFAGSAVHAITSPSRPTTAAFGLLFGALGMTSGWPVAKGGTGAITQALAREVQRLGGEIRLGEEVTRIPDAEVVVLNVTPPQARAMGARKLTSRRFTPGPAVHKIDFILREPVPWTDPRVGQAATVHLGGTAEEIVRAERAVARGRMPDRPFVMAVQAHAADPTRPLVLWTYAHVPHAYEGRPGEVRELLIRQIERFAPNFRDVVLDTVEMSPRQLEAWNPNLIGGDIAGGAMGGLQTLLRQPHRLRKGLYMASASTAPGAGVHGMPGWWAAEAALRDFA